MSRLVLDTEGNGFLEDITQMWCLCTLDPDTNVRHTFVHASYIHVYRCSGSIADGLNYLAQQEELICHNYIGYDGPVFKKLFNWEAPPHIRITDTLLLSKLSNSDRRIPAGCKDGPHSVQAWGIRFGRHKVVHEDWSQISPGMIHRCEEDVEIQTMIYSAILQEMAQAGQWDFAIWLETEFAKIIQKQNTRGWLFDSVRARQHLSTLNKLMDELYTKIEPYLPIIPKDEKELKLPLNKNGTWSSHVKKWLESLAPGMSVIQDGADGIRINGNFYKWSIGGAFCRVSFPKLNLASDAQLKPWLLAIGWVPIEWNIDKTTRKPKSPKLTEESLDSLTNGIGPDIAQWLKCKHRRSAIEGWLSKVRIDGTIMAPSNSLGTPTGRQTHKVIVNVPGEDAFFGLELRELFIAAPGKVIVGGDSSSCQARMLCHRMGDERFTDAVINGKKEDGTDLHGFNMKMLQTDVKRVAKSFFYGFIFGAQAAKVGSIIGKGKEAGQKLINTYFGNLPLLKQLIQNMQEEWGRTGILIGMDGRVLRPRQKHMLLCYDLQSGEAISVKLAAVLTDIWARQEGLDFELLIMMHDEMQYEVEPAHKDRFAYLLAQSFKVAGEMMQLTVPLAGEVKIGNNWRDTH